MDSAFIKNFGTNKCPEALSRNWEFWDEFAGLWITDHQTYIVCEGEKTKKPFQSDEKMWIPHPSAEGNSKNKLTTACSYMVFMLSLVNLLLKCNAY